jgi:hypothetical protein
VTTSDTVEARHLKMRTFIIAVACGAVLSLAGCETSSNLLSPNSPAASASIAPPNAAQANSAAVKRVAIAPVIGPPDAVSKALVTQLSDAAERQKIPLSKGGDEAATYTLRGYFVAPAKDKAGNKLSYIWDVTDSAGKRVNRITGEEVLTPTGSDPWGAVTPQIMQTISEKTATSLAAWLPTQGQGEVPVASASTPTSATAQSPAAPATPAAAGVATGSLPSTLLSTAPKVSGAPGDGNTSLAAAMKRELVEKGVQVTETGTNAYRVAADVKIKPPKDGTQSIAINWTINDPKGTEVAKITQNNEVPAGFLDKTWGPSAEDAARAASVQIKQVIADHRAGKQIQSSAGGPERKVN